MITQATQSLTDYLHTVRSFNRDVRLYLGASFLFGFCIFGGIYTTLLNLYLLRLGYGPEFAGLVNGTGQVAFALSAMPAGLLGRWSSRRILIGGMGLIVLGFGLLPLAEFVPAQQPWLLTTHIVGQIGIAVYFVNGGPLIISLTSELERNHAYAAVSAIWPLAGFGGSLLGGLMPTFFATMLSNSLDNPAPYRYPLLIASLLMILAVVAIILIREPQIEQPLEEAAVKKAAPWAVIIFLALSVVLRVVGEGVARTFINIYLDKELHVATAQIGAVLGVGQLLAVPAALLMPLIARRLGEGNSYILGALGMALSLIPIAFISHWAVAGLGYMGLLALSAIARPAIVAYQMAIVPPSWRPVMAGATTTAVGFGWATASLSGGYIITTLGYPALFLFGAAGSAGGALLFFLYFRHPRGEFR